MPEVRVVMNLYVRPEEVETFVGLWRDYQRVVMAEPGCKQYELFVSTLAAGNFAVLEWWEDEASFARHTESQQVAPAPGAELLRRSRERTEGRNTSEIYWDRRDYGYDRASAAWVARA